VCSSDLRLSIFVAIVLFYCGAQAALQCGNIMCADGQDCCFDNAAGPTCFDPRTHRCGVQPATEFSDNMPLPTEDEEEPQTFGNPSRATEEVDMTFETDEVVATIATRPSLAQTSRMPTSQQMTSQAVLTAQPQTSQPMTSELRTSQATQAQTSQPVLTAQPQTTRMTSQAQTSQAVLTAQPQTTRATSQTQQTLIVVPTVVTRPSQPALTSQPITRPQVPTSQESTLGTRQVTSIPNPTVVRQTTLSTAPTRPSSSSPIRSAQPSRSLGTVSGTIGRTTGILPTARINGTLPTAGTKARLNSTAINGTIFFGTTIDFQEEATHSASAIVSLCFSTVFGFLIALW